MDRRGQDNLRGGIAPHRRHNPLLIAAFLAFVTSFGYIIGFAWLGDPTRALFGLALALVVGVVSGLVSYFAGDKMVLAASRAREITHNDAPVAVTSGLLEKLDRDELQGVMAHEVSHVANFDIRYTMLVGILVGTTVLISD